MLSSHPSLPAVSEKPERNDAYFSSFFLELQLTILTLSALIVWLLLSSLKATLRIKKVQTSSQKR